MSGSTTSSLIVPGAIVAGKYRLDALIGEGGMGSVWSATHTGLNQAVAIKFISREFVRSADALRRFDAEAKAAAQLRSRHVVQVFDTGTLEDETPYIAMELLHGESLQARVHRGGPIPIGEAVDILAQCCKALGRAHQAGIIHRDIKPDNIFLAQSADDDSALVKILDFGVAKMGGSSNEQGSQGATRTGAVLGTPLYMSPEQARGLKTIDQRTDLYSLGLVAYTMLTGNLAFSSESFGDLLLQICTAPLPSILAGAHWLPPTMEEWFKKACAREPEQRFGSAKEFSEALCIAAGVTLPSRGVTGGMEAVPGMVSGMGMQRPAFASTGGGTSPGITRSGGDVYAPPGAGKRWIAVVAAGVVTVAALGGGIAVVGKGKGSEATPASPATPVAAEAHSAAAATPGATASTPVETLPALAAAPTPTSLVPVKNEKAGAVAPSPAGSKGAKQQAAASATLAPTGPKPHGPAPAGGGAVDLGY